MSRSTAKKTDPTLWQKVKAEVTEGDKGGRPGQWSARKAQLASRAYQEQGGGYEGRRREDNSLKAMERGGLGHRLGTQQHRDRRALPAEARAAGALGGGVSRDDGQEARRYAPRQAVRASRSEIAKKTARHRSGGVGDQPTRAELYEEAQRRNLRGRSKMSKAELQRALGVSRGGAATTGAASRRQLLADLGLGRGDHRPGEVAVGVGPGAPRVAREVGAQRLRQGPDQGLADGRVVVGRDAVGRVPAPETAQERQDLSSRSSAPTTAPSAAMRFARWAAMSRRNSGAGSGRARTGGDRTARPPGP